MAYYLTYLTDLRKIRKRNRKLVISIKVKQDCLDLYKPNRQELQKAVKM